MLKTTMKFKTFILLTLFTLDAIAQQDSSLNKGAKSFMLVVLKSLTDKRNDDSLCKVFVPMDVLRARTMSGQTFCNVDSNNLTINSIAYNKYEYAIDSICVRPIEKNTFYFRVKTNYCMPKSNLYKDYLYQWFKIWYDGKRYWLIPGEHVQDVCIDFDWRMFPCEFGYNQFRNRGPFD